MRDSFGTRLCERIQSLGPLCVGIDPSRRLLETWERPDSVEGLEFASLAVLEAAVGVAVAVKPQVAYFERFGSAGYRVLERVLADAKDADILVVGDVKRADIGSTNAGYAEAWLSDRSPLAVDAVTVSSYLGVGELAAFFVAARESGRGVFVLAATSNDEGRSVQTARASADERVQEMVLRQVRALNEGGEVRGSIGAVFAANRDRPDFALDTLGGPYLVPGVGAQGATPDHIARLFGRCPQGTVLVNVGRAILDAGPDRAGLRDAVCRWRDELALALP